MKAETVAALDRAATVFGPNASRAVGAGTWKDTSARYCVCNLCLLGSLSRFRSRQDEPSTQQKAESLAIMYVLSFAAVPQLAEKSQFRQK
jgi:hypothetical protein